MNSNIILCKYIVLSIIPTTTTTTNINPTLLNSPNKITSETNLVSFWQTPLVNNLFGLQPIYLGSYVPSHEINIIVK